MIKLPGVQRQVSVRPAVIALILLGMAIRLAIASTAWSYDVESWVLSHAALIKDPLHFFANDPLEGSVPRYPYPPGFFPFMLGAGTAADTLHIPIQFTMRLTPIAADAGIALLVGYILRLRGATPAMQVAGVAAVALGPVLVVVSGYQGQIDSLAFLPAIAALALWEREKADGDETSSRTAVWCGALIGVGACIKLPALLLALAMAPSARSIRERAILIGTSLAVPLIVLAPFLAAEPRSTVDALRYSGLAGQGGLSLIVQPDLARFWVRHQTVDLTPLSSWLHDHGGVLVIAGMLLLWAVLLWKRVSALPSAIVLIFGFYVIGINYSAQYLVWGLPFLIAAGYIWQAFVAQAVLVVPTLMVYKAPVAVTGAPAGYAALMIAAWLAAIVFLILLGRRIVYPPLRPSPTAPG